MLCSTREVRLVSNRRLSEWEERLALNVPEVARCLGIGKNQAYALARAGRIPTIRLGKRFLVPVAALERWLEEHSIRKQGGDAE